MVQYAKLKVKFPKDHSYNVALLKKFLERKGCEVEVTGVFLSLIIRGKELLPPSDFIPKRVQND
jgi:hypothetical protein